MFQRYPNPWSKHVLTEDVISRKVEGPILKTVRLISKTNKLPKLAQKVKSFVFFGDFEYSNIVLLN